MDQRQAAVAITGFALPSRGRGLFALPAPALHRRREGRQPRRKSIRFRTQRGVCGRRLVRRFWFDFVAPDANVSWGFDAKANAVSTNLHDDDSHVVANANGFAQFPGQHQHGCPFGIRVMRHPWIDSLPCAVIDSPSNQENLGGTTRIESSRAGILIRIPELPQYSPRIHTGKLPAKCVYLVKARRKLVSLDEFPRQFVTALLCAADHDGLEGGLLDSDAPPWNNRSPAIPCDPTAKERQHEYAMRTGSCLNGICFLVFGARGG